MSRWRGTLAALAAAVLVAAGCLHGNPDRAASRGAPDRSMDAHDVPVLGAIVMVVRQDGEEVGGELLAVDAQALWLRTGGREVLAVRRSGVRVVRIPQHGSSDDAWALGRWTAAGTISTLSHGCLLVLTAPAWLLIGGAATALAASGGPDIEVAAAQWEQLRPYARYPQGMPGSPRRIEPRPSEREPAGAPPRDDGGVPDGGGAGPMGESVEPHPLDAGTLDAGALDGGALDGGVPR